METPEQKFISLLTDNLENEKEQIGDPDEIQIQTVSKFCVKMMGGAKIKIHFSDN